MCIRDRFIDAINNFISEMKQYGCGPKELAEMIAAEGTDDYTGKKLADINLLFNDYEKQIKDRYTDSEDRIDLYLGKIRESELIRGNQIWVYGFDSFAPKTMALLGELMSSADEVNLLLTWDDSRPVSYTHLLLPCMSGGMMKWPQRVYILREMSQAPAIR